LVSGELSIKNPGDKVIKISFEKQNSSIEALIAKSFILTIDNSSIDKNYKFTALQTKNYLVLRFNKNTVLYCKCKLSELVENNFGLEFTTLPVHDWLDKELYESGLVIDYANAGNNPRLAGKDDVIQISTLDHIICFDLAKQVEADYMLHTEELSQDKNSYVDPGHVIRNLSEQGRKQFGRGPLKRKANG
jgi:hypothetical protein